MKQRLICPNCLTKYQRVKKIIITKHGVTVAILGPYDDRNKYASSETIKKLRRFRKNKKLKGLNLKMLIETGRD